MQSVKIDDPEVSVEIQVIPLWTELTNLSLGPRGLVSI